MIWAYLPGLERMCSFSFERWLSWCDLLLPARLVLTDAMPLPRCPASRRVDAVTRLVDLPARLADHYLVAPACAGGRDVGQMPRACLGMAGLVLPGPFVGATVRDELAAGPAGPTAIDGVEPLRGCGRYPTECLSRAGSSS